MSYREIYEEETGESIEEGWEVHHIDGNRENNNISNLVAMPKEKHYKLLSCDFMWQEKIILRPFIEKRDAKIERKKKTKKYFKEYRKKWGE